MGVLETEFIKKESNDTMKTFKLTLTLLLSLLLAVVVAACGGSEETATDTSPNPSNQNESVSETGTETEAASYTGGKATVTISDYNAGIKPREDWIENYFVGPVQEKYPEITVEFSQDTVQTLITAGTPPDIVLVSNPRLHVMMEFELPDDLTDMITKYNVDLDQFDPVVIDEIRRLSGDQGFLGLPFSMNYGATFYNKDIFDRFGVDYPKDGLDWDEAYELARELTRTDEGTNYLGMIAPVVTEFLRQYTLPVVDINTNTALMSTDGHVEIFSLLDKFYKIPGYVQNGAYAHAPTMFFADQTVAMYPGWTAAGISNFTNSDTGDMFQWDLTTFPVIPGTDIGKQVDFHMAVVNQASANKDAAYQVLLSLISEEVQTGLSQQGRITPLDNPDIRSQLGKASNLFEGKNIDAIFSVQAAAMPDVTEWDNAIEPMLRNEIMKEIAVNGMDVNTAIQLAEDRANKEIIIED